MPSLSSRLRNKTPDFLVSLSGSRSNPMDYHRLGHPAAIAQWIQQAQLAQQQQQQQQQQQLKDEPNEDDNRTPRALRGPPDYPDL